MSAEKHSGETPPILPRVRQLIGTHDNLNVAIEGLIQRAEKAEGLLAGLVKCFDDEQNRALRVEGALKVAAAHNLELQEENERLKARIAELETDRDIGERVSQSSAWRENHLQARIVELEEALQLFRKLYVDPHWAANDPAIFIVRQGDRITVGDLRNVARLVEGKDSK